MKLKLLAKDATSRQAGCESVYLATPTRLAFQGPTVDPDDLENVLPGEGGVYVDLATVRAALDELDRM